MLDHAAPKYCDTVRLSGKAKPQTTPAHLLVGVALCERRDVPKSGWMAAAGSLLPDLSLYLLAGVSLFWLQIPPERVFGELYFSTGWQTVFAIDNSFILWGLSFSVALL